VMLLGEMQVVRSGRSVVTCTSEKWSVVARPAVPQGAARTRRS
jgi:hypothetical protein